jgi:hypothetical protein
MMRKVKVGGRKVDLLLIILAAVFAATVAFAAAVVYPMSP